MCTEIVSDSPPTDVGCVLLPLARAAIAQHLERAVAVRNNALWLEVTSATFVTLKKHGELRGCIGTLKAIRPLGTDVQANAVAAAFYDPRFAPLQHDEFDEVRIEVSILSPSIALVFSDQNDALTQITPGSDGIIFECDGHRATFLPQVWEQLPDVQTFIGQLKQKAGLHTDFWSTAVKLSRYTVSKWYEP